MVPSAIARLACVFAVLRKVFDLILAMSEYPPSTHCATLNTIIIEPKAMMATL
jgi:hypothetical protein